MNFDYSTPTKLTSVSNKTGCTSNRPRWNNRSALAPLEMVLALPLLMGIMGLIMVFGFVASWKVRSEVVARDVGWRTRNPRSNGLHERSDEWPELEDNDRNLGLRTESGANLQSVDAQAIVHAPIIRGPIPEIEVNTNLLDLSRKVTRGVASADQPSQVMGEIGRVDYETKNEFLSEEFKYSPMGVGRNHWRRIPVIWNTELDVLYNNASVNSLIFAINELRDPIVLPIDEDMDFYEWNIRLLRSRYIDEFGIEHLAWRKWSSPPALPNPASYRYIQDYSILGESDFDVPRQKPKPFQSENVKEGYYDEGQDKIRETVVESYLYQIPKRPLSMALATRSLYNQVLDHSENDLCEPRLTVQEKSQLEAWVSGLNLYITQLQDAQE